MIMKLIHIIQSETLLPLFFSKVAAGFPNPASDYEEQRLSLDQLLISNKDATFFARVQGDSMKDDSICEGDIVVIDKSRPVTNGNIVLAYIEGSGFTVKRLKKHKGKAFLCPSNKKYEPIEITEFLEVKIWGVVIGVVRKL